jgi:hypothetical protein
MGDTSTEIRPPERGKLTCRACGRTEDCPPEQLLAYLQGREYPQCCGDGMAYFVSTGKPWEPGRRGSAATAE